MHNLRRRQDKNCNQALYSEFCKNKKAKKEQRKFVEIEWTSPRSYTLFMTVPIKVTLYSLIN